MKTSRGAANRKNRRPDPDLYRFVFLSVMILRLHVIIKMGGTLRLQEKLAEVKRGQAWESPQGTR